jgi:response regulator of citrate/malate metabolism
MNKHVDLTALVVLVVDDDEVFLESAVSMLEIIGVKKILRAGGGAHAVQVMNEWKRPIDCVLCDFQMRNGNGLQLLQYVRTGQSKYVRSDSCFILLTASNDSATVYTAAHFDVSGYLVKPISVDKLRQAIERGRQKYFKLDIAKYREFKIDDVP